MASIDDPNLYQYAESNPQNLADPTGQRSWRKALKKLAKIIQKIVTIVFPVLLPVSTAGKAVILVADVGVLIEAVLELDSEVTCLRKDVKDIQETVKEVRDVPKLIDVFVDSSAVMKNEFNRAKENLKDGHFSRAYDHLKDAMRVANKMKDTTIGQRIAETFANVKTLEGRIRHTIDEAQKIATKKIPGLMDKVRKIIDDVANLL